MVASQYRDQNRLFAPGRQFQPLATIALTVFAIGCGWGGNTSALAAEKKRVISDGELEELINLAKKAFKTPSPKMAQPVLIFPVIGADGRIRDDGSGLALLAQYSATYTPKRRMQISLPHVNQRLRSERCLKPNVLVTDDLVKMVMAAVDIDRYIVPQLSRKDAKLELTFTMKRRKGSPGKEKKFTLEPGEISKVPGIIAKAVHDELGTKLDKSEIARITTSQVGIPEDLRILTQLSNTVEPDKKEVRNFLDRNPECLPGWMTYLVQLGKMTPERRDTYNKVKAKLQCDELEMWAKLMPPYSTNLIRMMLEYAPQFRNDPAYLTSLANLTSGISQTDLVDLVLKEWRKNVQGYPGFYSRGSFYVQWAWKARGGGFADTVTDEGAALFRERLVLAREEFEKGLKINPLGWEAHASLIEIGMTLQLPKEFLDEHFNAAIKLCPQSYGAYDNMFRSLMPRWGGEPTEYLEFARVCIKSEFWDDLIPQLASRVMKDLAYDLDAQATRYTAFAHPDMWQTFQMYAEAVVRTGPEKMHKQAQNELAMFGAFGGHHEDVFDLFRKLEKEGRDLDVFGERFTFEFLRDRVYAEMETGDEKIQAAIRIALDAGDFDEAQQQLDRLEAKDDTLMKRREYFQRVIDFGRELNVNRSIELTAQQIWDHFDGISDKRWKIEGDELVCRLQPKEHWTILTPFGIDKDATVTGTIQWTQPPLRVQIHTHARALRDVVTWGYFPKRKDGATIVLKRNQTQKQRAALHGDTAKFKIRMSKEGDIVEPDDETTWRLAAAEQAPGRIAIEIASDSEPTVVKLQKLRIELQKAD